MSTLKVAKTAGFCKGVRKAVEKVLAVAKKSDRETVTLGPIIHNPQVLEQLSNLGIKPIDDPMLAKNKNVVIRAHGIPPKTRTQLKSINANICDATCPDVGKVQGIVKKHALKGYSTIIVGDEGHAEVKGLLGFAENNGFVINNIDDVKKLPDLKKICIVAQTTQQKEIFNDVCDAIIKKYGKENCVVFDTICPSTIARQNEVYNIAKTVDLMIIIGGKNSANTTRLAKISGETGTKAIHIEEESDLKQIDFNKYQRIGVTAGASTPNWMIKQIVYKIKCGQQENLPVILKLFSKTWNFIRNTNLLVAFAAGWLSYSACSMQNLYSRKEYFVLSFFYILAVYSFKGLKKKWFLKLNEPEKIKFYDRRKKSIVSIITISIITVLIVSFKLGIIPFILSILLLFFGFFYQSIGLPYFKNRNISIKKISRIPGSKDLFVVLGWVTVLVFVPLISSGVNFFYTTNLTAIFFVATLAAIRSIGNDIREIQEDMMVGVETLPIYMGKDKVLKILKILVIFTSFLIVINSTVIWKSPVWLMLLIPLWSTYISSLKNDLLQYSLNLNFSDIVDMHFIIAGLIPYLHRIL